METPVEEISAVVKRLTTASSPQVQKAAVEGYFNPDAGFRHPIWAVEPGANSRDKILGIYQWVYFRLVELRQLFVEVVQNTVAKDRNRYSARGYVILSVNL